MNKQILTITSAIALAFSLVEAKAADMTGNFYQEYSLFGSNVTGASLWLGNFGTNGGSLLSSGQVQNLVANDMQSLFTQFRPLVNLGITSGRITGLTADGFTTLINVGTAIGYTDEQGLQARTPDTASQFAGQNLYLLGNLAGGGASNWYGATMILFKAAANFGTGDNADGPLNNIDVEISTNGGTLIIGSQQGTPSDTLTTGTILGAPVPEPSSVSLLVLGGAALAALRLRRKKA
jgi:PEP-CTERM motif